MHRGPGKFFRFSYKFIFTFFFEQLFHHFPIIFPSYHQPQFTRLQHHCYPQPHHPTSYCLFTMADTESKAESKGTLASLTPREQEILISGLQHLKGGDISVSQHISLLFPLFQIIHLSFRLTTMPWPRLWVPRPPLEPEPLGVASRRRCSYSALRPPMDLLLLPRHPKPRLLASRRPRKARTLKLRRMMKRKPEMARRPILRPISRMVM